MSAISAAIAGGGVAAPVLRALAIRRRSVAARSRAGNCTATRPRSLQATPQVPIAVSNMQWLVTSWSVSMLQHVRSDSAQSTRNLGALGLPEISFDRPLERDQQRVPIAVLGLAGPHPDPARADAVLFDVVLP